MTAATYDMSEIVIEYREDTPGFEAMTHVEMTIEEGSECASLYVDGGDGAAEVLLSEAELLALINAAERAVAILRANA